MLRYTLAMRSIADDLRADSRVTATRLSQVERVALALRLGDEDLLLLSAARGVPRDAAIAIARRTRRHGRRRSACMESPQP